MNKEKLILSLGLSLKETFFLIFLISSAGFSTIIQLIALFLFALTFLFIGRKIKFISRSFFYFSLIIISVVQLLFIWKTDYSIGYVINTLLITFMWFLAFQSSNIVVKNVFELEDFKIEKILRIFFRINLFLVIIQIVIMCIDMKTWLPFSQMSAGDNVKGLFRNSSVNMIIMSFYAVFYLFKKDRKNTIIAFTVMVLTFYMSGLLLFLSVFIFYVFVKYPLKRKVKIIFGSLLVLFLFAQLSPSNIDYINHILKDKISSKTDPPRKLVSFGQTLGSWVSNPSNFIFGSGGGKFSSRTAFITAGEYVSWFPEKLTYISEDFNDNHFQLWNFKALSIPFRDGTANQPFSFYNKIIGEYGLLGVVLFLIYLYTPIKHYKHLTYGKIIFLLIFAYFLLDFWFEYFSVIVFLELFLFLDIKNHLKNRTINDD